MSKSHEAIVLKNYQPQKQKVVLFDRDFGKIECMASSFTKQLPVGSLIGYFPQQSKFLYSMENVEMYEVPLKIGRQDLYFFHHIIELCYYFLPLDAPAQSVFELLEFLLHSYEKVGTCIQKKLFLLRFFVQLGIYPEEEIELGNSLHYLLSLPIDVMLIQRIIMPQKAVEQWLLSCIATHPQKEKFKTTVLGSENAY